MQNQVPDRLHVFLCHASEDKAIVREIERRLRQDGFEPWLDEKQLLLGDEWEPKIRHAVSHSDAVVVCFSKNSVTKEGYIQRELRFALDVAAEKPEGTVFIIPVKLEECEIPERFRRWQWGTYAEEGSYDRLVTSLQARAAQLHRFVPAESENDPSQLLHAAEAGDANAVEHMRTLGTECEARKYAAGAIHWYRQAARFRDQFSVARLKDLAGGNPIFELTHTFSLPTEADSYNINDIALSADGRFAVFCLSNSGEKPLLWDAREWKELGRIKTHKLIRNTAFSPTGQELGLYYHYFIKGKYGGSAGLFDIANDRLLFDCDTLGWYCCRLWFHDDKMLLWENEPQFHDFLNEITRPSGRLKKLFDGRKVLDISRDTTLLAVEANDRSAIKIKERTTHKGRITLDVEVPSCTHGVAFSFDGKQFATQDDESVSVWDLASQCPTFRIDDPGPLDKGSLAFSPDGALLAIARGDSVLRFWDLKTGQLRQTIGDDNSVHLFAFRSDGKLLITGHEYRVVRVWQAG